MDRELLNERMALFTGKVRIVTFVLPGPQMSVEVFREFEYLDGRIIAMTAERSRLVPVNAPPECEASCN
jgi:hypothetical protein